MKNNTHKIHELTAKIADLESQLTKTEWLHEKENIVDEKPYIPFYGDVTKLNAERTILGNVGEKNLKALTSELMDLLDTSVAIYEKNGDYAYCAFSSGWCQLLDASSRKLCNTNDNKTALSCGKWICHDDCRLVSKRSMEKKESSVIVCSGEINIISEPIFTGNEVIGSINIGYGNPPTDTKILKELAEKYNIDFKTLEEKALAYKPRPEFIIEIAKKRLKSIANLIGEIVTRKESEKALEKSDEKYKFLFENLVDEVHLWELVKNKNGKIKTWKLIEANPVTIKAWKKKRNQVIGKTTDEIFGYEATKQFMPIVEKIFSTGKAFRWEQFFPPTNQYLSMDSVPLGNYFISTGRDVSEEKQMERQIKKQNKELKIAIEKAEKSEANLSAILEGTNSSIWAFDREYKIIYINHAFQKDFFQSFGVKLEPGMSLIEALPDSLRPIWKPRYDRVLANEQFTLEDAVPTTDGTIYIEVTFNPILKNGQVAGGSCFGNNITSRKKVEEARRISDERFRIVQDISPDGFTILHPIRNKQGRVIDFSWVYENEAVAKLNGTNPEKIIGKRLLDLFPGHRNTRLLKNYKQVAETGKPITFEESYKGETITKEIWVRLVIVPMRDNIAILSQDITERKKTEHELIKAKERAEEADRLKSAFLANMSHEIRTPMNGIMGFTNLLQQQELSGEERNEYIEIIQKSGNRMLNTVNDIIEISKIETGQIKVNSAEVNISEHLSTLCKFFIHETEKKGLKLIIDNDLSDEDSWVISDKNKLSSILTNLIKNSIKFTKKGSISIGCRNKGDVIEIYVKDTGIGIPNKRQDAIFNRFEQADIEDKHVHEGSGLGLAIVKSYVEMLGGTIWVKSQLNKGSTFFFTIPFSPVIAKTVTKNTNKKQVKDSLNGFTILIVEDDDICSLYLTTILKDKAKNIQIVKNGLEAIEICKEKNNFDLILMDLKIPGINGLEASKKIRENNNRVKIIAQTAHALEGDKEKALEAGCDDYISKPIDKEKLIELINKHLKTK